MQVAVYTTDPACATIKFLILSAANPVQAKVSQNVNNYTHAGHSCDTGECFGAILLQTLEVAGFLLLLLLLLFLGVFFVVVFFWGGKVFFDRSEVRQDPVGSGEQGKMEETGCEIICGAPTTFRIKGQMMMMMIPWQTPVQTDIVQVFTSEATVKK